MIYMNFICFCSKFFTNHRSHSHLKSRVQSLKFEGDCAATALDAIHMAAHYPFRQAASKHILLVTHTDMHTQVT